MRCRSFTPFERLSVEVTRQALLINLDTMIDSDRYANLLSTSLVTMSRL